MCWLILLFNTHSGGGVAFLDTNIFDSDTAIQYVKQHCHYEWEVEGTPIVIGSADYIDLYLLKENNYIDSMNCHFFYHGGDCC